MLSLLVLLGTLGLGIIPPTIQGDQFKPFDILSDIRQDIFLADNNQQEKKSEKNQNRVERKENVKIKTTDIDQQNNNGKTTPVFISQSGLIEDYGEGRTPHLSLFFSSLERSNSKPVRIAYYGDSLIEGDIITQDLRNMFQQRYGGSGVGFVPVTSVSSSFRVSVKHTYSGGWKALSVAKDGHKNELFGINGEVYNSTTGKDWIKCSVANESGRVSKTVLFAKSDMDVDIKYSVNNEQPQKDKINGTGNIEALEIYSEEAIENIKISLDNNQGSKVKIYGLSMENQNGVYVDNFSIRGHSGIGLRKIPIESMKQFHAFLGYNLIVLQFGVNVSDPNVKNYDWYEKAMIETVVHMKKAFPNSSIMLMSTSDRGTNINGSMQTASSIIKLVEAQKRVAQKTNIAFFNLFEAMGGKNSMNQWVKKGLAGKDYTHLTRNGGKVVAERLFDELMTAQRATKKIPATKEVPQGTPRKKLEHLMILHLTHPTRTGVCA